MSHLTDVIEEEVEVYKHDYAQAVTDVGGFGLAKHIEKHLTQAMTKVALAVLEQLECSECNGSGARSTPSDYSPCSECDGTGFNLNKGCLNDHIYQIKTTLTTNK